MGKCTSRTLAACSLVLWGLVSGGRVEAQEAGGEESPRVQSVVFEGTSGLDEGLLRDSIATQETRCRGLLLRPFCAVSDAGVFVEKHDLDRRELALDEIRIRVVYFRRGYRQARVESSVTPGDEGVVVTFDIDEGPLTRVASLAVSQSEPVLDEGEIAEAGLPAEGEPLDLMRVDSAVARMAALARERGRGDVEIVDSAAVDTAAWRADLRVRIEHGPVTTVDAVVVEGNEGVSDPTIRRLVGLSAGEVYRRSEAMAGQRRLYETELFRQALVTVPDTPDSAKTVVVSVREAPPRAVRLTPGFSTLDFGQAEARFTHHDWLGGARRLDLRAAVGNLLAPQLHGRSLFGSSVPRGLDGDVDDAYLSPTWRVGVDLTQPFFLSPRTSLGLGISAHRRSVPGIVIDRGVSVNASVTRTMAPGAPVSVTYRFERTHIDAGEVYFCVSFGVCDGPTVAALQRGHRLSRVGLSARLERSDGGFEPTRGYRAEASLEHASELTLSDFAYQRATAEASHYRGLGAGVLAGRVRAGWVRSLGGTLERLDLPEGTGDIVHPRIRLHAGGSRSVRGYAQNQLGPRVLTVPPSALLSTPEGGGEAPCTAAGISAGTCDPAPVPSDAFEPRPMGGNTVLEASIEYRHPLGESLTGAVFVDAGVVGGQRIDLPSVTRSAVTPGFGIRYRTPVGRVRLDLGIRPTLGEELPVVTEVIGPQGERRLVRLRTLKVYDPIEDSGGLRSFLSRLQLHLAIGEAF